MAVVQFLKTRLFITQNFKTFEEILILDFVSLMRKMDLILLSYWLQQELSVWDGKIASPRIYPRIFAYTRLAKEHLE